MQSPLSTLFPFSSFCWCLLLENSCWQKDTPTHTPTHTLWLNSGPLRANQSYGSLLPPESRMAFPVSWGPAGPSVNMRPPYGWCCERSGTSWAGEAACIPWHYSLDLHRCRCHTCPLWSPLLHVLPFWLPFSPNTGHPTRAADSDRFQTHSVLLKGDCLTLLQSPEALQVQLALQTGLTQSPW